MKFMPHAEHISHPIHGEWDCNQCHLKPTDVMSNQHVFDSTPAKSEVIFSQGLSSLGIYDGNGGCSNLYCHGTGKQLASYVQNNIAPSCTTCHPTNSLSGRHQFHLNNGIRCDECHVNVVRINTMIAPQLHVNGSIDVQFSTIDMNRLDNRCSGSCHGETHRQESW